MTSTIFITGASSGIGKAIAFYFHRKKWQVAATMRRPEQADELSQLTGVRCMRLDVSDPPSITGAIKETIDAFGGIDVLVNNAGYGTAGAFEAATEEQIYQQFETNVFGLMRVTREILPYFRSKNSGTIINVSSMGGRITFPLYSVYHSTKWAVEGFSESLQYELAPFQIHVKLIEPGAIKTDFYHRSQVLFQKEGLTAYDRYVQKVMANVTRAEANAPPPEVVAQMVYQAAIDTSDRMRYSVGDNTPLLLLLRRLLPYTWFQGIVRQILEKS